jgi:hypothetical protein
MNSYFEEAQRLGPAVPDWVGRSPSAADFPTEPYHALADPFGVNFVFGLALLLSIASLLRCTQLAFTRKDPLPLVMCITAFLAIVIEPICDVTLGTWFPTNQIPVITFFNRPIPLTVALLYTVYFPPTVLYLTRRFEEGITKAGLFTFFGATLVFVWFFEVIPIHWQVWFYHHGHPFAPLGFSYLWGVPNAAMLVFCAATVYATRRLFPRWGSLMAGLTFPMAFAGWLGIAAVATAIFNTPSAMAHPGLNWIGQILVLVTCLYLLSVLADMLRLSRR